MSASATTAVTGSSDFSVQLRQGAVATLMAYGTLAGPHVEDNRLDPIGSGDMPRITVAGDEDYAGASQAGTTPQFNVSYDMVVSCYAERAAKTDVVSDIDTMVAQVKDCLLGAPTWINLATAPAGTPQTMPIFSELMVRRVFKTDAQRFLGEGHLKFKLTWRELYPPRVTQPLGKVTITTNARLTSAASGAPPIIGAIRFDAFYDAAGAVNQQYMAALSPSEYNDRLPANATVSAGVATWPTATQATMDAEITAAVSAGLGFWAFDSYQPADEETAALTLYLSSSLRSQLQFAMLGQMSNWVTPTGYAPSLARDISMFSQPGYLKTPGGNPVYFVLADTTPQLQVQGYLGYIRTQAAAAGVANPYIVMLDAAAMSQVDNTGYAQNVGADAAGAYSTPILRGFTQPYAQLVADAEADWAARLQSAIAMVPTAMAGFNPAPLITTPIASYPIPAGWFVGNDYADGTQSQIAAHIQDLQDFITANQAACPANIGLVYAWNEAGEGGWIWPTYLAGDPAGDQTRLQAIRAVLTAPTAGLIAMPTTTITLPPPLPAS